MSSAEITIYHNPRCSKSRETLQILTTHGQSPRIINYLDEPPSVDEIERLLRSLKMTARDLLRTTETIYRELALDDPELNDRVIIKTLHEHPSLLQRPIVVRGDRAVVGRPPSKVLELLD